MVVSKAQREEQSERLGVVAHQVDPVDQGVGLVSFVVPELSSARHIAAERKQLADQCGITSRQPGLQFGHSHVWVQLPGKDPSTGQSCGAKVPVAHNHQERWMSDKQPAWVSQQMTDPCLQCRLFPDSSNSQVTLAITESRQTG